MARLTPEQRDDAMRTYVRGHHLAHWPVESDVPPHGMLDEIVALREEIRADEGGGGKCSVLSEALEQSYGWGMMGVAYVSEDGEVICEAHVVSVLADGTIVDGTADQFGEGHDVRVVAPGDAGYGRYRPEFHGDFHPGISPAAKAWRGDWTGEMDLDAATRLRRERGGAWWIDEPGPMLDYLARDLAHTKAGALEHEREIHVGSIEALAAEVEARFAVPSPR